MTEDYREEKDTGFKYYTLVHSFCCPNRIKPLSKRRDVVRAATEFLKRPWRLCSWTNCVSVFGVVAVSLVRKKLSKFVAQQRGHFSTSWELKSVDRFIWFLDSLSPMPCLGLRIVPLKYSHASLFHSLAPCPAASTLDLSYSLLLSASPSQTAESWRKSHNLESCFATDSSSSGHSETPSIP